MTASVCFMFYLSLQHSRQQMRSRGFTTSRWTRELIVLELVLSELEIEKVVDTLEDRVCFQKAVYLSQEALAFGQAIRFSSECQR